MNQTFSWATFSAGMGIFVVTASETIRNHNEWSYFYSTPLGFFHGVLLGSSFMAIVVGAIGAQIPRSPEKNYGQRREDIQQVGQPEGTTRTTVIVTKPADPPSEHPAT